MKVLITGGLGFLGKHVVQALQSEHELVMPSRNELNLVNPMWPGCTMREWLHGAEAVNAYVREHRTIDAIIHLAGNVGGIGYNQNNQGKLGYENLQMGLNVLEGARLANVKKVVMVGTTCSYPLRPKTIPFVEQELFDGMPESTNSGYGIAKRTLIKLGMEYASQYGMNITNFVPANMYGPYDHFEDEKSHVIPAIIKKFEEAQKHPQVGILTTHPDGLITKEHWGIVELWGTGNASREFLYAEDCAIAIALSLAKDTGPEPINLGTCREITIAALAAMIKEVGKYDAHMHWDSSKPDGQPRRSLDVSRAKNVLGWEARTSLEVGLKQTIEWYRRHG
jgi:GDP-L-fucose synthase